MVKSTADFVGVTFGELLAWYRQGTLRVARARLHRLVFGRRASGEEISLQVQQLLESLPDLVTEDDADAVLVELLPRWWGLASSDEELLSAQSVKLDISTVECVIPLTERATRILRPRMQELRMKLGHARFEEEFRIHQAELAIDDAEARGRRLARMLVADHGWREDPAIRESLRVSMRKTLGGDGGKSEQAGGVSRAACIRAAFGFTRHAPRTRKSDYLADLGKTFRTVLLEREAGRTGAADPLQPLLDVATRLSRTEDFADFAEMFGSPDVLNALETLDRLLSSADTGPFSGSLLLFLKWKQTFEDTQYLDPAILGREAERLSEYLPVDWIAHAIWLLGAFLPGGVIEGAAYASDREMYRFYEGPRPEIVRLEPRVPTATTDGHCEMVDLADKKKGLALTQGSTPDTEGCGIPADRSGDVLEESPVVREGGAESSDLVDDHPDPSLGTTSPATPTEARENATVVEDDTSGKQEPQGSLPLEGEAEPKPVPSASKGKQRKSRAKGAK